MQQFVFNVITDMSRPVVVVIPVWTATDSRAEKPIPRRTWLDQHKNLDVVYGAKCRDRESTAPCT